MCILDGISNLNVLWVIVIIVLGLCFITTSIVLLFLEKAKNEMAGNFSGNDRELIVKLVEERTDELTVKMDLLREDVETVSQSFFDKTVAKIDELKSAQSANLDQKVTGKMEALVQIISDLTERADEISKKSRTTDYGLIHHE